MNPTIRLYVCSTLTSYLSSAHDNNISTHIQSTRCPNGCLFACFFFHCLPSPVAYISGWRAKKRIKNEDPSVYTATNRNWVANIGLLGAALYLCHTTKIATTSWCCSGVRQSVLIRITTLSYLFEHYIRLSIPVCLKNYQDAQCSFVVSCDESLPPTVSAPRCCFQVRAIETVLLSNMSYRMYSRAWVL